MASSGGGTGQTPATSSSKALDPPGHSFLSSVNEVRNMENSLLALLSSFTQGSLSAFGKGHSLETMEAVRAKQEKLEAVRAKQERLAQQRVDDTSQDWLSDKDQNDLIVALRELSNEVEKLHDTST